MTKSIYIVGAGGFGREVKQLIEEINQVNKIWEVSGFFDNKIKPGTLINGTPVLGTDRDALESDLENFVFAIANPGILRSLSAGFISAGKKMPNIIHPASLLGNPELSLIGTGNVFTYGFYMTTNVKIGDFNIFNTRVTIGHDVKVGSFNVILPNVQISGNVSIGDENFFGMNSSILESKTIGSRNKIGAHSFLASNLKSDQSVFGNPATKF